MTTRNYTDAAYINALTGVASGTLTDALINLAETYVDGYVAIFLSSPFQKAKLDVEVYDTAKATFTTTTATITASGRKTNYYKYCALQILEGNLAGTILPVLSSVGSVLTIPTTIGLTGSLACQIYQPGKFPMNTHTTELTGLVAKWIPDEIKQAVAWQAKYITDNPNGLFDSFLKQSESIGENYSYTNGNSSQAANLAQYVAPKAKAIIDSQGWHLETL